MRSLGGEDLAVPEPGREESDEKEVKRVCGNGVVAAYGFGSRSSNFVRRVP